jgi:hypothetical protein
MTDSDDLSVAWAKAQARLPTGWSLDGICCASTGLSPDQRSDDWIAVAVGPGSADREVHAGDPIEALAALASSFEQDDGELATESAR